MFSRSPLLTAGLLAASTILAGAAHAGPVTFSRDVAPIFFEHCAMCHRPGEIAPMSLLTYDEARPWAKSIAKVVRAGEMPPWSGESENHSFSNDISLTDLEIETIVDWVKQGAREGDIEDLPKAPEFSDGWKLGEPDYVITLNEIAVPADGDDLFLKEFVTVDIDEEKWLRAIEFLPGDNRVTHHFQSTYNNSGKSQIEEGLSTDIGILGIWTAGMPPYEFPEGMGRVIGPNTRVLVDSHYHPMGEATTDQTKIGLYFGEGDLEKEVLTLNAVNTGMRIPPGESDHAEVAYYDFDHDLQIIAFSPHLHVRGKAMKYDLRYADGTVETLLDVPKYDYNWQWLYYPTAPIDAPQGSRLEVTAVWDNSPENPSNPDPSQEILYRGDTFNEMFVGFFEAIEKDGVRHDPMPARDKLLDLAKAHPPEDTYFAGGFLPFSFYVPKEGEGWMYLVNGSVMFSITLDDYQWDGDSLFVRAQLPTPEAGATESHIVATLDEKGRLKGSLTYGIDYKEGQKVTIPILGQPMAALQPNGRFAR